MFSKLHIDFESRSTVDLRKTGVRPYVEHPDTDIWFCGWAIDDGPVEVWYPKDTLPDALREALEDPDTMLVAHNASFEWNVIEYICAPRYGWPRIPHTRMDDTAARAAVMALPRSLDGAARALGLDVEKDQAGHRLMLQMCKPRRYGHDEPIWWNQTDKVRRLAQYCITDVEVERALDHKLRPLTERERALWDLDFEINYLRGVRVDTLLVRRAEAVLNHSLREHGRRMMKATRGRVTAVSQIEPLRQWVISRGYETDKLDKAAVDALLSQDLDERTRAVLTIRKEAGKTSTAKLKKFQQQTAADGRAYGALLYHGASTGRWTGSGIQLHNLPRPSVSKRTVKQAIDVLRSGMLVPATVEQLEFLFGPVPTVLSDCLRGMLIPSEGTRFLVSDFSNIEGRGAAWLAGQSDKLAIFRVNGPVYERMGAAVFNVPIEKVTKDSLERWVGKTLELGAQYGLGWVKFQTTCADYGRDLDDELCQRSIETFRRVNHRIVALWADLEEAAMSAVLEPGTAFQVPSGKVVFQCHKKSQYLMCRLPSGRIIYYPWPKVEMTKTPWGAERESLTYETTNSYTRKWERVSTFGGKLLENCIAEGTLVLTGRGWVAIEDVQIEDQVHDGVEFVSHGGSIFKSVQDCVRVDGVHMTPDHEVLTSEGWEAASQGPRPYRPEIRDVDRSPRRVLGREETPVEVPVRVRRGVCENHSRREQGHESGANTQLRLQDPRTDRSGQHAPRDGQSPGLLGLAQYARSVSVAFASGMEKLRGAWHHCLRPVGQLFRGFLDGYGPLVPAGAHSGPNRQQQRLLPRELSLGHAHDSGGQPQKVSACGHTKGAGANRHPLFDTELPVEARPVYDILNAGPRQRFVVLGAEGPFIVHNCVQALARDMLAEAMMRLEMAGYRVVLTVHDEIVAEAPHGFGSMKEFDRIMSEVPDWAEDFPVAVEGFEADRYRK